VTFDLTLNVLWLLLGALAIGITLRASSIRGGSVSWRLAGIVLVVAALFPFVSATDDIVRVEHYTTEHDTSEHGQRHSGQHNTSSDDLIRLYEALDAPVTPDIAVLAFVLLFVSLVIVFAGAVLTRVAPGESGRSPPVFFSAA
jgi:hypothetical protein